MVKFGQLRWSEQFGEAVHAPVFAADAVVDGEDAVGVVALLDAQKTRVVRAPEGLLPIGLEVIAFVSKTSLCFAVGREVHGGGMPPR